MLAYVVELIDNIMPYANPVVKFDVPPMLTMGNVCPVTGISPTPTIMFINACIDSNIAIPTMV
jgi:hypothetical protein